MRSKQPISRRGFLKANAGFLMAPLFVPPKSFGSNDRVNVGMIGMGRQAVYVNMKQFLAMPEVQLVAVCDVDRWRLENAKKSIEDAYAKKKGYADYSGCQTFEDWRELLESDAMDAVMISTPDHWHVPMALRAVKAGKDVSCEKPLTLSIAEGRMLADAVKKHERVFRTDSEFRSLRVFHRAVELVVNGRIGEIKTIRTGVPGSDTGCEPQPIMPVPEELNYEMWVGPAPMHPYTQKRVHPPKAYTRPGWMRVRETCEGMITNWGAHLNDIAQWGNGTERTGPVEVEAEGEYPKTKGLWNVLTRFEVYYRFANGVDMYYITDRPYVRFEGTEGWIQAEYGGRNLTASSETILNSEIKDDEIHYPLKSDKQDFIDAVRNRGNTLEDAEVGHRTTSLCQLGHIALQIGKRLSWDPSTEVFTNHAEANDLLYRPLRAPWSWKVF